MKVKTLKIADIVTTEDKRVKVELAGSGQRVWIPKKGIDFAPGVVIFPMWYWDKILSLDPVIRFLDQ